jgi:hypothetical protein
VENSGQRREGGVVMATISFFFSLFFLQEIGNFVEKDVTIFTMMLLLLLSLKRIWRKPHGWMIPTHTELNYKGKFLCYSSKELKKRLLGSVAAQRTGYYSC